VPFVSKGGRCRLEDRGTSSVPCIAFVSISSTTRDGFGSDMHENESECHHLPYFNSNTNIIEYKYKTNSSISDTYLIWNIAS
jgi:hypothetical protein